MSLRKQTLRGVRHLRVLSGTQAYEGPVLTEARLGREASEESCTGQKWTGLRSPIYASPSSRLGEVN